LYVANTYTLVNSLTVVADLFPLALSIITIVYLISSLLLCLGLENPFTAIAHFEIGAFGLLGVFWLGRYPIPIIITTLITDSFQRFFDLPLALHTHDLQYHIRRQVLPTSLLTPPQNSHPK
jgi:hypothetical protein